MCKLIWTNIALKIAKQIQHAFSTISNKIQCTYTLEFISYTEHTHIHTTHTAHAQTPEDCNNVPDYCIAENVEPINSNFPL